MFVSATISAILGLAYLALGGLVYLADTGSGKVPIYASQVLEDGWGFNPAQPYPLQVGGTVDGSRGSLNATTYFGLFSGGSTVSGSIQPAEDIKLGVNNDGASYILLLPTNEVKFHITSGTPYALFTIASYEQTYFYPHLDAANCDFWMYTCNPTWSVPNAKRSVFWPQLQLRGLGPYLQAHAAEVDLYVPRKAYDAYLNN